MIPYRPTWASIHLDHLKNNIELAQQSVPNKTVIPVIKANAYGHGAQQIFTYLIRLGYELFAVSLLEEALELRALNQDVEIMMLGPILKDQFEIASKHHIQITLYDEAIIDDVLSEKTTITCHLKVDTGMSRYGLIEPEIIIDRVNQLQQSPHVNLKGIYTHFSTSNENEAYHHMQYEKMCQILSKIDHLPEMVHMSNSSSLYKYEHEFAYTTHVRLGISLYGLSLDDPKPDLRPVMSLHSKVVQIKHLQPGDCVGYGATYQAKKQERIAVIPIGYADGWIRRNKTGHVEINQHLYKIVGIICMDACFVKVDENVNVGDIVTLFGGMISTDDVAHRLNTINYEVTCLISSRVPRIYEGGI